MAHKRYNLVDNWYLQLANSISPSIATINVVFPTLYTWNKTLPTDNWIGTLVKYWVDGNPSKMEKVYVTATSGTTLTVTRGYLWDGAQSFDANDYLFLNIVAEHIDDLHTRIDEVELDKQDQLDDLYEEGTHRLRVYRLTGDPALQVRIGTGSYRVGSIDWLYAGGTLTVSNNVTTYVMINSGWVIQTSTSAWDGQYARLAIVVSSGGVITSITNYKSDSVGGDFGGVPTGAINIWSTNTSPTGWFLCDGTAVSRSTYAGLFSVIGTTYGVGNGSTTFNLPNLKGRIPVGRDSSQTEFDTLAETGGAKTHTLTTAEMPAHKHRTLSTNSGGGGAWVNIDVTTWLFNVGMAEVWLIEDTGGGGAHNNLQPYLTLNYIIKT